MLQCQAWYLHFGKLVDFEAGKVQLIELILPPIKVIKAGFHLVQIQAFLPCSQISVDNKSGKSCLTQMMDAITCITNHCTVTVVKYKESGQKSGDKFQDSVTKGGQLKN